jgi:hypothetical protein
MPGAALRLLLPEGPLPSLIELRLLEPGLRLTPLGFDIPLHDRAPEEVLALCLRCGITARATRVVREPPSG